MDRQDRTGKAPARHSVGTSRSDSTTGTGTDGNASVLRGATVATPRRHWHQHDSVNSSSDHRRRARGPGTAVTSTLAVRRHQAVGIYELDEDQEPCQEEA